MSGSFYSTQTADALIYSDECVFDGIVVMPDGTNDVTVTVYDNSTGSGSTPVPTFTFSGTGGAQALMMPCSVRMGTGIYVNVTVAGGGTVEYTVYYRNQ